MGTDGDTARRAELAGFLKTKRAALSPQQAGLAPDGSRRRTPGLRREEVAQLAGVGLSWYTWLEQGRAIAASEQVLGALARALQLTPPEREHLFLLAGFQSFLDTGVDTVDEGTAALVEELLPHAAFVLGPRFDVLAHNRSAELILGDLVTAPAHRRNLLVWLFAGAGDWTGLNAAWEQTARANLSDFRTEYARRPGDPAYVALVEELLGYHEKVREWWAGHEVATPEPLAKQIRHPRLGALNLLQTQSRLSHRPALRLRILVPADETTRAKLP
ncbi:helix-turn-helix transcriptional regulator [Actinoplanes sp. TFC3]|uniref:helix-turn-helix transcriptional regulator n=1 Tax=Actinoplanes sp. TFC3 TaxID=1710355 RepID=UPI00082F6E59|nr:helix-turn-helix transcriptional regulator [Actinoplanes sp. TFC3]